MSGANQLIAKQSAKPAYEATIDHFAALAATKVAAMRGNPLGFLIGATMAGAYVGMGIILIFSIGQSIDPSVRSLAMGASFGIALTLVVFAGSELFTGHTMFMTIGRLRKTVTGADLGSAWSLTWLGNLLGSVLIAGLFVTGGGGAILKSGADLIYTVAAAKMGGSAVALVARAILCNWLVCLALWMSARTASDAAKCIVIFWCLFAFIASGFEHSVANMTLFTIALLGNHPDSVSLAGMAHNLLFVTIGNIIGGALFMGVGYWRANAAPERAVAAVKFRPAE
jgi:nitrite transporter